jgi:hypothetical protein
VRGWSAGEEMDGLHEGLRGADGQGGRALLNLK